jgi:excisionase family DNA binding protein
MYLKLLDVVKLKGKMTKLLSVEAAAELLSISPWTVRKYVRIGKMRPIRIGRRVLLEQSELERFVNNPAQTVVLQEVHHGQ